MAGDAKMNKNSEGGFHVRAAHYFWPLSEARPIADV